MGIYVVYLSIIHPFHPISFSSIVIHDPPTDSLLCTSLLERLVALEQKWADPPIKALLAPANTLNDKF